jgi:hypothetical protein
MTGALLALTLLLAAANGSNDDPKGVATLGGSGVTGYRHALAWGVIATLAGSVVSVHVAAGLTKLFSTGIVTARPTPAFALSVLVDATAWVALATITRLPVSTTHALIGSLVGAGLVLGPATIAWASLATHVVVPLVLSVVAAYAASGALGLLPGRVPECFCVEVAHPVPGTVSGGAATATAGPVAVIRTGTVEDCQAQHARPRPRRQRQPPALAHRRRRELRPRSQRHPQDRRSRRLRPRPHRHHHGTPRRPGRRRHGRPWDHRWPAGRPPPR